ncbi:hypothetical protein D3C75_981450 [compost metagenome]
MGSRIPGRVHVPGAPGNALVGNTVPPDLLPAIAPHAPEIQLLQHLNDFIIDFPPPGNLHLNPGEMLLYKPPVLLQLFL